MRAYCANAIVVASSILLLAGNASAAEPAVCDPAEDPYNCKCPNDGTYDVCYQTAVSNLISPDDPGQLAAAANISSVWNSGRGVYEVTIDATQLSAAGVIKLNSNHGQWNTVEELHNYVEVLIGQDFADACTLDGLPPMVITQIGKTARYDQFKDRWADANSGSLLYDAITDANGNLTFGGTVDFDLFSQEQSCRGTDVDSSDAQTDGTLSGTACSLAESGSSEVCGEVWSEDPCSIPCRTYSFEQARTDFETSSTQTYEAGLQCTGVVGGDDFSCDPGGFITHGRVLADDLYLQNLYFLSASSSDAGDMVHLQDEVTISDSMKTGVVGVCGWSQAEDGANLIQIRTKDGTYDASANACNF